MKPIDTPFVFVRWIDAVTKHIAGLTLMNEGTLRVLPNRERQRFSQLREQSDMLELVHPGTPARASALADSATPKDSPIFIRGQAETPGASAGAG